MNDDLRDVLRYVLFGVGVGIIAALFILAVYFTVGLIGVLTGGNL